MKNILSYLFCLLIAVILTFQISGTGGIFIITLMICALIVSLTVFFVSARTLRLSIRLSSDIVGKGDSFCAEVEAGKSIVLPTCFVEAEIGFTPNIGAQDSVKLRFICAKRYGDVFEVPLRANLSGYGEVYIKSVWLIDYMGVVRKKLFLDNEVCGIKIIPEIPDTGSQSEVLRSTSESMSFDDSDEESDETAVGLTGVPGYEHRKYVSGDPLKRINWKLSAKKNELMVRLDERVTSSSQAFILDYPKAQAPETIHYENADLIIEASLAMLSMLLRSGYESEFSYRLDSWETVEVKDEKSIRYLQERLAGIKPYPVQSRFPDKNVNKKGKPQTCFTTCTGDMKNELTALCDSLNGSLVVSKQSGISKVHRDMWTVDENYEFTKMQ